MILGGAQILWAVGVHSYQGSGHKLDCDKRGYEGMVRHGWDQSGQPVEHRRVAVRVTL